MGHRRDILPNGHTCTPSDGHLAHALLLGPPRLSPGKTDPCSPQEPCSRWSPVYAGLRLDVMSLRKESWLLLRGGICRTRFELCLRVPNGSPSALRNERPTLSRAAAVLCPFRSLLSQEASCRYFVM